MTKCGKWIFQIIFISMTKTGKRIIYGILIFLAAALIGFALYMNSLLPIITGYAAKNLCSAVFVSERKPENVESVDLNFSFIKFTKNKVNYDEKSVTSRFLWGKSKAIYREGFGVTLLRGVTEEALRKIKYPSGTDPGYSQDTIVWPLGDILPKRNSGIDTIRLDEISKSLINDNAYNGNAFAFMVVHKGIPVAEAYKPLFTRKTRLLSWSMAKSFTNALVGILVKQGKLDVNQPAGLVEWKDDDRNKITLNDLMQMQSGLKWNEDYGNRSDVTLMLHLEKDMGYFALERPEAYLPGTHWYYSSGATNIVSRLIRRQFINDSAYYIFPNKELFNKIGIPDAVFEVDPSGTRIGSSYLYATARDYARFGLLFINDGVFNGERILPEGWVKYTTAAASASNGLYGSFFWLNRSRKISSAPEDMYACDGHDGQHIYIIPSRDLIVVILGYSPTSKGGMDVNRLLKDILSTLN
jgi:CubicO group peptidase (beta-lactamase class C family)